MSAGADRLVLLGTKGGPAIRRGGPNPTASLLVAGGMPIVVDCGLGVTRALVEAGLALPELRHIVITHLHSDHVLELGPLIHTAWTAGLRDPVTIWGPVGTAELWAAFCASMAFDIGIRQRDEGRPDLQALVRVREFGDAAFDIGPVAVHTLRVNHPPVTDCFALRFDVPGWRVVFSADTAPFPPLADFARGADILVHEAMLATGIDALCAHVGNADRLRAHLTASHTYLDDAVALARDAQVGRLVLHHLVPCDLPGFGPDEWDRAVAALPPGVEVIVGRDGLCLERVHA